MTLPEGDASIPTRSLAQKGCPECGVHPRVCVCRDCAPVVNVPEIWVLQHPDEVGRTKGTLRVAQACLPKLRVLVGESGDDFKALEEEAGRSCFALLFPRSGSLPLEQSQPMLPRKWIILDGTWRKAKRLFLSNPWLTSLPAFHFQSPPPSRYRIRKSNREAGLSTVESLGYLISLAYPDCDGSPLDAGLDALVEAQLAQMPREVRKRYE